MDPPGRQGALLRVCWYGAAVLMAAFVVQVETGLAGDAATSLFQDYVYNALLMAGAGFCLWRAAAIREERLAWLVMGAGILVWTGADVLWTAAYADDASPPYPSVSDALWLASVLLVGLAAWQPAVRVSAPTHQSLRMVLVPAAAALTGIGLLTYDHFDRLNRVTLILTAAALLLVVVRTALLFYENQRMIS